MTGSRCPERGRYNDHPANTVETKPFFRVTCPFLRHQARITRFFEVFSCSTWALLTLCGSLEVDYASEFVGLTLPTAS
jgi:hypothetical protein